MKPCLLFGLPGLRYAIDASLVQEIFWLPELAPADEAPSYIAGVMNLRGQVLPVMDLDLRLGHPPRRMQPSDCVIVVQADGATMGVVVAEVSELVELPDAAIEPPPRYDGAQAGAHFVAGGAKVGDAVVMLLDAPRLLHAEAAAPAGAAPPRSFCPGATPEERELFRSRAHALMQAPATGTEGAELTPLSIVQIGGERFGIELEVVREFCHLRRVTPVPCCPPHIAGNMNLRGDILTLADIAARLNLPFGNRAEVMVVEAGELRIGVPVDRVLEVIYLRPADISPLPAAHAEANEFGKGAAPYGGALVTILDMQALLAKGGLQVEESV